MTSMCPQARFLGIIKQEGYKLAFRGQKFRSYLTVLKDPKHHIFLGIYQINDDCEISLDIYEDYPNLYYKENIEFEINGEISQGLIYIMNENYEFNKPSSDYFEMVIQAYNLHNIDISILIEALNN